MTSDKNNSAEEANFHYYSVRGCYDLGNPKRMSPSSWDDSEEEDEMTDTNSNTDNNDLKLAEFYNCPATDKTCEEEEDRRQSSARVRRRKKDSTKNFCVFPDTGSSSGNSFTTWDDQDTDGIIFDIEIYANEQNFPKGSDFVIHEPASLDAAGKSHRSPKFSEENKNFRNLNVNLSRIVEVDESKSSLSLGSANNLNFVMASMNCNEGARSNNNVKDFGSPSKETSLPDGKSKILESSKDDAEISTEDKTSIQNISRLTIMKNLDDVYCKDREYFDNTLMYFFEAEDPIEKEKKTQSCNYELDSLYFGKQVSRDYLESAAKIEENELFQSFQEVNSAGGRNHVEDKISIDKVEDVSNCTDTTQESGTPKRHDNLTGREKDHALSKESLEMELENLFPLTRQTPSIPSTSKNDHDKLQHANYDLLQRSGCFLRDMSLSRIDADIFSRLFAQFDETRPKSPLFSRMIKPEGMAVLPQVTSGEYMEDEYSKGEVSLKFLRKYPSYSKSIPDNEPKVNEIDEGSIRSPNKSKSSFKSNISFELDVSDKSSATEMKIYGDSFTERESSVTSENTKNSGKSPSSIAHNFPKTGKPPATRSNKTDDDSSNQNQVSVSKQERFGFGDFGITEWSTVRNAGENTDYPQDRGDMKFESYNVKSEWGRLIVQLDERCRANRPVKSIFRVDVQENLEPNKMEHHWDKNLSQIKSFKRFGRTSGKGRVGNWTIAKAKKRKRESSFLDSEYVNGITLNPTNNTNQVIKKNWLVNTLNTKRKGLKHGKGSFKTFLIMRWRGQTHKKSSYRSKNQTSNFMEREPSNINCFRTFFKRIVNFFTVFCHKNRN